MTAIGSTGTIGKMGTECLRGFHASLALGRRRAGVHEELVLRDTDDTEDSDEEEEEAMEEDAEREEPDSDVLWTAELNTAGADRKPSRKEIEDELEESEDGKEESGEAGEEVEDRNRAKVDRAIDAALRMSALAMVVSEFVANTRGLD